MIPERRLKESPLALFTAYFDDSGTHKGSPNLVVGGFLGLVQAWQSFEVLWPVLLRKHGITHLHSRKLGSFSGEFKDWDATKRRRLVSDVAGKLNIAGIVGIATTVNSQIFREVFPRTTIYMRESAFGFIFRTTILKLCKFNLGAPISVVLEEGNKNNSDAFRVFNSLKKLRRDPYKDQLGNIATGGKLEFGALQAADFLAFNVFKNMGAIRSGAPVHENFVQLMEECSAWLQVNDLDRAALEGWKEYAEGVMASARRRELTSPLGVEREQSLRKQILKVLQSRRREDPERSS